MIIPRCNSLPSTELAHFGVIDPSQLVGASSSEFSCHGTELGGDRGTGEMRVKVAPFMAVKVYRWKQDTFGEG